ncbi:MAG TPA: APC family permease, partial [Egibacteraceae bacterium]|nr:APC family permease [Egibacteraceae bacterium]
MPRPATALKRALVGRPRTTRELQHTLLPKWMALPVFSSDALSSVAYATQEMMIVLALAGTLAFSHVLPLSLGVALLLVLVVSSYRQTVRAYPQGGGAYIVARENLGTAPGLIAGGALLIDYVLTVAVSIAAGMEAITSAVPALIDERVLLSLGFVAVVTVANLRGVKEAGLLFAIPTYLFITSILALIGLGLAQCVAGCPQAPPTPGIEPNHAGMLTLFLLLRAFASGATALTGVEAISNGVPAFRYPQSHNAAATLGLMGALSVSMFLGISYLAVQTGVQAGEGMTRTVVASIALAVYGGENFGFYVTQVVTALILVLAANTAYADFPRLSSVLAQDRFLPRQFAARGNRLVFSNGIMLLAVAASALLIAFQADVTRLIQLYVVGVFTSFTLSQSGMVRHWLRRRSANWVRSALINGVGGATTAIVLVVVAVTKFTHGAWIVMIAVPALAVTMHRINRHYFRVGLELRTGMAEPEPARPNHVVVLIDGIDEAAARAVSYAQTLAPASLEVAAVPAKGSDLQRRWEELGATVPLRVLAPEGTRDPLPAILEHVREKRAAHPGEFVTALIAETLSHSWWDQLVNHRLALRTKTTLLRERDLVVADLTSPEGGPGPYTLEDPSEHHVVVLVSAVNQATMRALAYAHGLQATSLRALSVSLDAEHAGRMLEAWEDWGVRIPLDIVDSPFRS